MKKSLLARLRRRISSRAWAGAVSRGDSACAGSPGVPGVPGSGVEALEPRLLLSGVALGDPLSLDRRVDIAGDMHRIVLPESVSTVSDSTAAGRVYNDVDGDGYWDPGERALAGVTVFADVDGDKLLGAGEAFYETGSSGWFSLSGLPTGDYAVRAVMPDGYKAASAGSAGEMVSIASDLGVEGLTFGLVKKGHDLGLAYSGVSMPGSFKTGTRVKVPVILTNHGNTVFRGGDTRLRVWVSSDVALDKEDTRLAVRAFKGKILPGQSVKIELDVKLPDALSDFYSYLIVDAVGQGLQVDLNLTDHTVVSEYRIRFEGSDRQPSIGLNDLNVVLANWNVVEPYGGYEPGDGFVGIDDLNEVLGNWNAGNPPTGGTLDHTPVPPWHDLWQPWLDPDNPGAPVSISGALVHDPESRLSSSFGALWPDYEGLAGWTVYLDQNRNQQRDADEPWVLTEADGSYIFEDLPTNSAEDSTYWPMLYVVHVEVPEGWAYVGGGTFTGYERYVSDGVSVDDINLGFYTQPQVGDIWIEGGYLANGAPTTIHATDVSDLGDTIKRVVFYYADSDNRQVDDILGVDTDGSDGYSVVVDSLTPWEIDGTHRVYAVAEDFYGQTGGHVVDAEVRNAVELKAGKRLVYRDIRGAVVTTVLTGPGTARVSFAGGNVSTYDYGDVVEVSGGNVFVEDIVLVGTTGRSQLRITTPGYSDSKDLVVTTGVIRGGSPLGLLYAPKMSFTYGIEMLGGGVIRNIRVGSVNNLTMLREGYGSGVKISARHISGRVELGTHLRVLNAGDVTGTIVAPSAGRMYVRNDLAGRIELTDADARQSLALLDVKGVMNQTTLLAASSVDTVQAARVVRSHVAAGAWTDIYGTTAIPSHQVVRRSAIQNFQAGVFRNSSVAAWRIVEIDLDRAPRPLAGSDSDLIYHRLVSYQGPRGIDRTVI